VSPAASLLWQRARTRWPEYSSAMDKKEINSPKLTAHFVIMDVRRMLLLAFLAHYVWRVF
jgi:hypothetical protein